MKPIAGMIGRDESMPNVDLNAEMASEERERVRLFAQRVLADPYNAEEALMARAILRYVPAGVPESAPHPVAAADDQTRPATTADHTQAMHAAVGGLKPCTCDNVLGSSVPCRGTAGLGAGWYCQLTLQRGAVPRGPVERDLPPYTGSPEIDFPASALPAPGVICEPIDDSSSGVCEASDDSSTTQHRPGKASPTLFINLDDQTRK